jgi:hypothetical protein
MQRVRWRAAGQVTRVVSIQPCLEKTIENFANFILKKKQRIGWLFFVN